MVTLFGFFTLFFPFTHKISLISQLHTLKESQKKFTEDKVGAQEQERDIESRDSEERESINH